jgi:hypothetical protein
MKMADEKIDGKYGVKDPNEGVGGKLASNMTGEAIEGLYDYGSISDGDKAVVNEIIKLLRERKGVPSEMVVEELKTKFDLVEVPMGSID